MTNRKILMMGIVIVIVTVILGIVYFLVRPNDQTSLSVIDMQWISNNNSKVVDVSIAGGMPLFSYDGEGIIFEYFKDLEDETGLEFNKSTLVDGDETDYQIKYVDSKYKLKDNEFLLYEDSYVVLAKKDINIEDVNDFKGETIGVLTNDLSSFEFYMGSYSKFITYDTVGDLFNAFNSEEVKYISIPHALYLNKIIENDYYVVSYINDIDMKYILSMNKENSKLNEILEKYYTNWSKSNLLETYDSEYFRMYISLKGLLEKDVAEFKSIRYKYGYIDKLPYEFLLDGNLVGTNAEYLTGFSDFAGIEFEYVKYGSIDALKKGMVNGEIDMMFNYYDASDITIDILSGPSLYDEKVTLITNKSNSDTVISFNSVADNNILVISNSDIADYFDNMGIEAVKVDDFSALEKSISSAEYIALDTIVYDYYKHGLFHDYRVAYESELNEEYNFTFSDKPSNKTLVSSFSFYVRGLDNIKINTMTVANLEPSIKSTLFNSMFFRYGIYIIMGAFIVLYGGAKIIKLRNRKTAIIEDNKLKYVDMLTSLKNRNYLNNNIPIWNENDIYPQTIIVINLNKVAHINDVHGHEEGDKIIVDAASILINNQLENSDIMRTNGDEFMIYLIGYEEEKIRGYAELLSKEFKALKYSYGAAVGYHMIMDDVTTIDEAIVEATIDMKEKK